MTFSTRHIFAFMTLVFVALVAAKNLSRENALLLILAIGIGIAVCVQKRQRRFLVYGALLGVFFGIIAQDCIVARKYSHLPDVPVAYGRRANTPGATERPQIVRDAVESSHPYGPILGFILGGTWGLLLSGNPPKIPQGPAG